MSVTPCRCRLAAVQDDEKRDDVGNRHPDIGVRAHRLKLPRFLFRRVLERLFARRRLLLLDFLRGLPQEQIRTDRSPEHRRQGGQIIRRKGNVRYQGRDCRALPWDMNRECGRDVYQQHQR
jgi:hypothetical protein